MSCVEYKQAYDHGENHQGVDHHDSQVCRSHIFYVYIFVFELSNIVFKLTEAPRPIFLSVVEMSIGLGSGVAAGVSSQVRAASEIVK